VRLFSSGKLLKRLRQLAYLASHPASHRDCATVIRDSRLSRDWSAPFKYLGEHLALSLDTERRREALIEHYSALGEILAIDAAEQLRDGMVIWRKEITGEPPMQIILEQSRLAPMEGELQLRFSFKSSLCVLTFLVVRGETFGAGRERAIFIGGVQGRPGAREEMREAARLNGEIAPTAMLLLATQALASVAGIQAIIGVAEEDHVSMSYSPAQIIFNYSTFWTQAGGERVGSHYRIPIHTPQRPLSEIPLGHRRRTRLKREAKQRVRESLEQRLRTIIRAQFEPCAAAAL
jgi:uncharacterized protein VirK/YbjX